MNADTQLMLIAGGGAAILLALVWRFLARRRRLTRLDRHLRFDDDPASRARAGNAVVELGLPLAAKRVLRAMVSEPDERVRLSMALAVARRQWEPARAKRVVNLRQWASEELELQGHPVRGFGPAVTRLADMGGPRPPENEAANGANGHGPPAETPAGSNGANGSGRDDYPADEPTMPVQAVSTSGGIRWVAPDVGDRT
jgi:hypothetical protein